MQNLLAVNGHAAPADDTDERRRHKRKPVLWKAHLETPGGASECAILDLSLGGAQVRVPGRAVPRRLVTLVIERFGPLDAEVVWTAGNRMGLRFIAPPEAIARTIGSALPLGNR